MQVVSAVLLRRHRRAGRPRAFRPAAVILAEVMIEVKTMLAGPPTTRAVPLSQWSLPELAAQAMPMAWAGSGVGVHERRKLGPPWSITPMPAARDR
jgi:hypothetical protein